MLHHVMTVEFLGIPRARAGTSEVDVDAGTLGELLHALSERFPALGELITSKGFHPAVAANLNGDLFISDLDTPFAETDRLLILSADVGG